MEEEYQENKAIRGSISQIILKALTSGDKYGYEIIKEIEELTQGKLVLKQPSLYSCLKRMEEQGLVSSYWEDSSFGGKRHYYSLTDNGAELYENNKKNWTSDEELISSLPLNEFDTVNELPKEDNQEDVDDDFSTTETFVANQESLFNLTKKNTDSNDNESHQQEIDIKKESTSFFQFDLFNEKMSFVKNEDKNIKENIPQFENKFSNLDNNQKDIEPTSEKNQNINNIEENTTNQQEDLKIKREEVLKSDSEKDNITAKKVISKISWDDIDLNNKENVEEDYKDVIGQLYSNSRLPDPYEQNKYQNFKEIFPTSKFEEEKKLKNIEEERNSNIENIIKSNQESNIDCEDMKNLNDLYKLQGIEIKLHKNKENLTKSKVYTDKNKLGMTSSLILSLIMLIEIMFSYIILKNGHFIATKQRMIFYLSIAFIFSFALISILENLFDRYRLVIIDKTFKKSFMQRLFLFIFFVVVIFALNIIGGMTNLSQPAFLCYWLVPTLLSLNLLIFPIIYYSLLKSKVFSK